MRGLCAVRTGVGLHRGRKRSEEIQPPQQHVLKGDPRSDAQPSSPRRLRHLRRMNSVPSARGF